MHVQDKCACSSFSVQVSAKRSMKQATVATPKIVVEAARIVEVAHAHVDLMNESYQIELNKLANVSLNGKC